MILQPEHFGLEVIRRLRIDLTKAIKLTGDFFPYRTWEITMDDVGMVITEADDKGVLNPSFAWRIDWSYFRLRNRKIREHHKAMEHMEIRSDSAISSTVAFRLQRGDILVRPGWLNMFLLYRTKDTVEEMPIHGDMEADFLNKNFNHYRFKTALSVHSSHWGILGLEGSKYDLPKDNPYALMLEHYQREELLFALGNTALSATLSGFIKLRLDWLCLLRFWELAEAHLLRWDGVGGNQRSNRQIGTWDEEVRRVAEGLFPFEK
jgi:hypothetical protein